MRQGMKKVLPLAGLCLVLATAGAYAQRPGPQKDPFQGKLFAPNVILENRDALAQQVEYVGLSFVRTADDVVDLKGRVGNRALVVAKIEKVQALRAIEGRPRYLDVSTQEPSQSSPGGLSRMWRQRPT